MKTKGLMSVSALVLLAHVAALAQTVTTVKEIVIRGNVHISKEAIRSAMASNEGQPFTENRRVQDEKSVKDLGVFKDVKIQSQPLGDTDVRLLVDVTENPFIKEIRISGNTVIPSDKLLKLVTQNVDQVYNFRTVAPTTSAISKLYEAKGYLADVSISPLTDSVGTLDVHVIEQSVGDLIFTGLKRTRASLLRRMIKTQPGRALNIEKLRADKGRIESTQWFESVTLATEPTSEPGRYNILMDLKETRTGSIGFGATLDPRSRLAGTVSYRDSNYNGLGHSLGVSLQQDTAGSGVSGSFDYTWPFMDSRDTSMALSIFSRINSYFTGSGLGATSSPDSQKFDERRTGAALSFTRPFQEIYSTTVGFSAETIRTVNLHLNNVTDYIQQDGSMVGAQFGVARDSRDIPLDPTQGEFARVLVEPYITNTTRLGGNVASFNNLLGHHKFIRGTAEFKKFWRLSNRKLEDQKHPPQVLAYRIRYSQIKGTSPFFEQLFMGGSDSLRGYVDQRYWGKKSFLTSAEYRLPVQKALNLIGFVDYGGAWGGYGTLNGFSQSNKINLHLGYGVGVGFRTPLGLIRIDFGFSPGGPGRTHFSIGGGF